jgi:hypothetical protein
MQPFTYSLVHSGVEYMLQHLLAVFTIKPGRQMIMFFHSETPTECDLNVPSELSSGGARVAFARESTALKISCAVSYRGTWIPVIRCTNIQSSPVAMYNSTAHRSHYNDVIPIASNLNNTKIRCVTSFDNRFRRDSELHNVIFTNDVPDLELTWESPTILLLPKGRVHLFLKFFIHMWHQRSRVLQTSS